MFFKPHCLVLLISIVPTCPGADYVCRSDEVYSDIRMMESSQTPHWEVIDQDAGLVQLFYDVAKDQNENATLPYKDGEGWTLELYHLFWMDNQALAKAAIQNCSTNHTQHENPYTNGTANRFWCKLRASRNVMVTIKSDDCTKCLIKGKLHSSVFYSMGESNSHKEVKWLFNYVYSGWYVLLADQNMVSAPVWLETKYTKQDISNLTVVFKLINYTTVETRINGAPLNNDCYNPLLNTSCVEIGIHYQRFKIYYNNLGGQQYCSKKPNGNESIVTSVHWNNDDLALNFRLNNLDLDKSIPLYVKAFDTRCRRGVWGWENKSGSTCAWRKHVDFKGYNKASHVEPTPATTTVKTQIFVVLIVAIATLVAIIVLVLGFLGYKRFRNRHNQSRDGRSVELSPKPVHQPPSGIFLLYARDCHIFMETMEQFRELLKQTTQTTVYDIWDEKVRDELYTLGDVWALSHLEREMTRVIVVVTPVCRRIEKFILDNQWPSNELIYHEPNSLDEVFVSAFKSSIRMTSTHPERCRKFVVCRMSSTDCSENHLVSFRTLCTIYTLPSLLDSLITHLLDGHWEPQKLAASVREPFEYKINELEEYIKQNPAHEDKMLGDVHD